MAAITYLFYVFLFCIFATMRHIICEPIMECDTSHSQSTKIADSEFCNLYYECFEGNLTERLCSFGNQFSTTEDDCIEISNTVTGVNCTRNVSTSKVATTTESTTLKPNAKVSASCKVFGICPQKCNDTTGSIHCSCIEGFKLEEMDNRTCTLIEANWKLLHLTSSVIGYTGGKKRSHAVKLEDAAFYTGITFNARKSYVCWTDAFKSDPAVYCSNFNGSNFKTIANSGIGSPQSVALDWVTDNVYFVDWGRKEIIVCGSDINECSVLVTQHVTSPNDLVLDPNEGLMFWTNRIGSHKIMRADMDGSNLFTLLNSDIKTIEGLAIDHGSSRLYWIDTKFDKLESSLLSGKDRRVTTSGRKMFLDAFVVDVFGDNVFWVDRNTNKIMSADKFTGGNVETHFVNQRNGNLRGGKVLHSANQPIKIANPCNASVCSHICVLSPESPLKFRCVCPMGMRLALENWRTCVETPNYPKLAVSFGRLVPHELSKRVVRKQKSSSISKISKISVKSSFVTKSLC